MPTKERSEILTFYLGFKLVLELIMAFVYFFGKDLFDIPYNMLVIAGCISLINALLVYYLFQWKKWAFWGLVFTLFIMLAIKASIGAAGSGVTIALLYALFQTKKNGVKAWDNLETINKSGEVDIKKKPTSKNTGKLKNINELKQNSDKKITMRKNNESIILIEDKYNQLKKLGEIYNKGILTSEEFETEKQHKLFASRIC